jgi:1-acyl-sn-glycerol-3-phosphate acyltransferase
VTPLGWAILVFCLFGFAFFTRWVMDNPREGDPLIGLAFRFVQVYVRVVHHLEVRGREHIPQGRKPGPLVVVCNHTAGVDPLLVQSACPFEIRWMMALDMRVSFMEMLWEWADIIFVDRTGKDAVGARDALRHVKSGGVLGVFPEGAIERPARHILPFHPGVGLIVSRTGAPVLPVIIEGTPQARMPWTSLRMRSYSKITFGPLMRFDDRKYSPAEIAQTLQEWYIESTGWPTAPTPATSPAYRERG